MLLVVSRAECRVADEETLHLDLLGDEVDKTLDTLALVGGGVVLRDLKIVSCVILIMSRRIDLLGRRRGYGHRG
jgi:hypothetical protein